MESPQLYVASQSPRRRTLIEQLGISYAPLDIEIDEQARQGETPQEYVMRMAIEKARKGRLTADDQRVPVLGADTCIVFNHQIIGKIENREAGIALLKQLSSHRHTVLTGIALVGPEIESDTDSGEKHSEKNGPEKELVRLNKSTVTFRAISDEECDRYWDSGEPLGKAGGYAIQGMAAAFIKKLEGSYSGVMGLPLCELTELMQEFGIKWYSA